MASHLPISKYNPFRRHHQDGAMMTTALPPINRTNSNDKDCEDIKEGEGDTQRRRRRLTSIKDFVRKQKRHKQRETSSASSAGRSAGDTSSVVVQAIRPASAGSQTSASNRTRKYVGRRDTHPRVDQLVPLRASGSKRMSYPPSEFHRQELASSSFARLRRDNSRSCPMLCDCTMYEFDDDDEADVHELRPNSGDKTTGNVQLGENGIDKSKTSEKINGVRFRVKSRSKSQKDDGASFARAPRPPSWQTLSPKQNLTEPERKTNNSSSMLKKIGRSKSEEIGTQRTPDGVSYRPSKPPMWQTVTATQAAVQLDTDGNTEASKWAGYAKSEGQGNHKQVETASYKPPKPPSWQTVTAEPEDVAIDTILKPTENKVPTITIPSNSSGPLAARADGRCTSAGSSRSTRSPCKIQVDDADDDDHVSPETAQASASSKSRGVRRSNIKRTRSRMIDAREIPTQDSVIPLSQTKPSEFNLRETHHDNDVYLSENVERCRQWLAGLLGDGGDTLTRANVNSLRGATALDVDLDDDDELVTCELELTRDKWMYVGSPYPSSSSEEEEDT